MGCAEICMRVRAMANLEYTTEYKTNKSLQQLFHEAVGLEN